MFRNSSAKFVTLGLPSLAALIIPALAQAKTYYVAPSPTGSDSNGGSEAQPFASIAKAQTAATAGDTVYFRGGTYAFTAGTNTCSSQTATVNAVVLNKSGTAGNLIHYWAYAGETPVFDFSAMKDDCRVKGFDVTGSYIHVKGFEITGAPQNNNLNHESWGLWNSGSNNIFELINAHHNMGPGIFIQNGGDNLILNCDSHHNYDPLTSNGAGQSADGFGCHISAGHKGNIFRGCRAWWNTDDGYDFINAFEACTIENSWAWNHGYLPGTTTSVAAGNGNGIKAGGYGAAYEANAPQHIVRNCLSVANKAAGFYANHHPDSPYFYNNTSYGNNPDFNMLGITSSGADSTVGIYRNNLAFSGTLFSNRTGADETFNSWSVSGITVSAADFQSVSVTGLDAPRQADGSLPVIPNFHLAAGSDLIDKGTELGLPFAGTAPDLGCFETSLTATGGSSSTGGAPSGGGAPSDGGAGTAGAGAGGGPSGGRSPSLGGATASSGATSAGGAPRTAGAGGAAGNETPRTGGTTAASSGVAEGTSGSTGGKPNGAGSTAPGSGTSGTGTSSSGAAETSSGAADSSGCSCSTPPRPVSPGRAWAVLLVVGGAFRRRWRRPAAARTLQGGDRPVA